MRRLPLLALAAALACTSAVTPDNPYDPATPLDRQAKARVTGRIDAPSLLSLAAIDVFLRQDGRLVRSFSTDAAGAFVFDALTPGAYAVEVAPPGFLSVTVPLGLEPGEEADVGTLSLTPMLGNDAAFIKGEATLGAFAAAPAADHGGILVEAVGYAYTAVTASTGAFQLTVPEGTYTLRISHPDYVAATVEGIQIGKSQTVTIIPVVLATNPASVAGHVVAELPDGSLAPLTDALVSLDGTSATGLTNATGDFTLDQLAPGSYLLRVVKAGYATASVPVLNLDGGEVRALTEPLSLALERGALHGSIALADAPADASGVVVEVTGTGRATVTGTDGGFAFDGLVAGTYEVRARRDGYGMQVVGGLEVTAGATTDVPPITLMRQGGAISIADGTVTRNRAVSLVLGAPSAASFRASEDPTFTDPALGDTTGTHPYGGPGSSAPFTLSDRDGAHDVHVMFVDAQGNASAPSSASIVLDRVAPAAPSLVIGSGAGFTSASTVALALSAQDLPAAPGAAVSGLWKVEISNSSDFAGAVLLDYNVAATWGLAAGDGVKAVYARFSDRAGNVSAPASASITVDTVPPAAPSIALSGGAGAPTGTTGSPVVTAALSATDANAGPGGENLQARLSNSPGFVGATWTAHAPSVTWLLSAGDGAKTVYAQFMDPAGNQSLVASDAITLAGTPPTLGSITVADGAPATSAQVVPVTLSASGAAEYRLYVNGQAATGWLPYATSTDVDLGAAPDEATRRVSVSFRNAAGVEGAAASTTIVFDQRPPTAPTLAVNGGAAFTGSAAVSLSLSASDGPSAGAVASGLATVEVANDPDFTASAAYPYTTGLSWTLAAGADGARTVYARFRDNAGNVSAVVSATVTLDTVGPAAPSIALAGNAEAQAGYTGTPVITATLSATDANEGAGKANLQVRVSNDAGFAGASWQPYSAALPWVLPIGDGAKTVHAQFRDAVGNASLPVSAVITLAATPPSGGTIALAGGAPATRLATVAATLSATNATRMQLYVNGVAVPGGWIAYATSTNVDLGLAPDESSRTVSVVFRNAGGVEGGTALTTIVMDRTAPTAPSVVVNAGAAHTGATGVTLAVSAQDGPVTGTVASGLANVEVANDASFTGSTIFAMADTVGWTLPAGDGGKVVYARFLDRAGNVSTPASDGIVLDTTPPSSQSIALAGNPEAQAGYTGTPVVTATLSATDANEGAGKANLQIRVSNDAGFAGASWQPYTTSLQWVLPTGDGTKTVYAQFRDAAGNASSTASNTIQLLATPPTGGSIVLAGGATATSAQVVSAAISASGAVSMRLSVNGAPVTAWIPYATATTVDLGASPDQATRAVTVSFRNAGGVEGGAATDSIRFDRTAPAAGTLTIAGTLGNGTTSATLTATPAVVLQISPPGGDEVEMAVTQAATSVTLCSVAFASPLWQPVSRAATLVLTGADGAKRACALFRDAAGNFDVANAATASVTLDTTAPTNPEFTNLASRTQNSLSAPASGVPIVTASTDATAGGVTYQCVGGTGTRYGAQWTDCGSSTTLPFAWTLAANQESTLGVRARDAAYNYSPGSFVRIVHDNVAPFPPFITDIRASRDSVTVTWDATADADVVDYLVYYGNATADYAGTGSAQGPSPVQVTAVSGESAPSLTLTNLTAGLPYYLAVEAVDAAGNRSGPGGQRLAVPNKANPRVLSTFGGQPRTMGSATSGSRTFLYLAEHQGLVQLDVSSDVGVPVVVGRAYLPDLVPDQGGSLAVIPCSRGVVTGHCVLPAGATAEGDYRGDADNYRASLPIVFFKTTGTAAAPVVGTIEGLLPVRPHRVLVGTFGGESVIVTVDRQSVRAFTFKAGQLAFLRQVARDDFNASVLAIYAATLVGDQVHVYARVDPRDDSAPNLFTFGLTGVLAGAIVETRHGPLEDDRGFPIGDIRSLSSVQDFVPAFHDGVFLSYVSALSDQTVISWYQPGFSAPQDTLTLPSGLGGDGTEPVATAGGVNQNLYVFVSSGMGVPEVFQVLDDGGLTFLSSFTWGSMSDAVAAHAGLNHLSQERLWAIESSGFNRSLERYTVSGTTIAHLADAFRELPPEAFAESDRFVYVAAGPSIHTVEAANPYTPTVVRTMSPLWLPNYTKVFTHGRFLYGLGGTSGLDVFRMNGDGSLTFRTFANDPSITDAAVVGRWLFTVSGSGLRAWDVTNVGAASASLSLVTTLAPGAIVNGITARYDNGTPGSPGVNPVPQAVIYAVTSAAELRTYAFNGATLSPLGSTSWSGEAANNVTVKGDVAVAGTPGGSYLVSVSSPAFPSVFGTPAIYPLSGPALLQNGYVVGLGPYGEASGPVFGGRSAAGVDGAIRFSACNAPVSNARGSLTHVDGRYAASCGRNGIAFFTPVSVEGGRLLKSFDVTATWNGFGAALASDGVFARLAGPTVPGDGSRLYTVSEQTTAEGTLGAPVYFNTNLQQNGPAGAAGADVLRSASFMVEMDGAIFVVTRRVASAPTVDAYDPAPSTTGAWTYLGRFTFAGTAEPAAVATDGEYLYVARNSGLDQGQVDVVDIRNPLAMSLRASWPGVASNHAIAALALSRERLYAGMAQGLAELNEVRVLDVSTVQASGTVTARTTAQIGVEGGITGVAVVGRTLFYTLHDPVYQVPQYAVGLFRLSAADRDGAAGAGDTGAASIVRLETTAPGQAPVVAGDVLYVASNLGTASFDLAPYWREGASPAPAGGVNLADPFRTSPVTLRIDGPFASMVGGTYRVFDLR